MNTATNTPSGSGGNYLDVIYKIAGIVAGIGGFLVALLALCFAIYKYIVKRFSQHEGNGQQSPLKENRDEERIQIQVPANPGNGQHSPHGENGHQDLNPNHAPANTENGQHSPHQENIDQEPIPVPETVNYTGNGQHSPHRENGDQDLNPIHAPAYTENGQHSPHRENIDQEPITIPVLVNTENGQHSPHRENIDQEPIPVPVPVNTGNGQQSPHGENGDQDLYPIHAPANTDYPKRSGASIGSIGTLHGTIGGSYNPVIAGSSHAVITYNLPSVGTELTKRPKASAEDEN